MTRIRLYGTVQDSIVDGPGLRYAVFVQGCTHGCPGCHNPDSQPAEGGTVRDLEEVLADIAKNPLIKGVTISGGEPFEQPQATAELAQRLKEKGYDVWTFTGYLFEDLRARKDADIDRLIQHTDVLVDGPFVESQRSLDLHWRGSANQRILDMPATRAAGRPVEWSAPAFTPPTPASW